MSEDEKELIARFLQGEEHAFRILYRRHTPVLFRMAHRSLATGDEGACDAVQEAWLRAARSLGRFRGESSLQTWLLGILLNCCRERTRSKRWETLGADDRSHRESPGPAPDWASRIDLEEALRQLPPGCREVLLLHDVEGYTHLEIGSILSIEPGTSKSQLFRARKRLRSILGDGPKPQALEKSDV